MSGSALAQRQNLSGIASSVPLESALAELDVPQSLQAAVRRHHEHLGVLIESLRTAGIREDVVQQSVQVLIEEYKAELCSAIAELTRSA